MSVRRFNEIVCGDDLLLPGAEAYLGLNGLGAGARERVECLIDLHFEQYFWRSEQVAARFPEVRMTPT